MLPADYQFRRPVGSTGDIPIHRPSVGGMALAAGSQVSNGYRPFKPYVYRGWGVDLFDPDTRTLLMPSPEPKPKPRKRRKRKRKPKPRPLYHWAPQPEWYYRSEPEPEPEPEPLPPKPLRPAPGWQPLSGDDLDAMLNEIGEGT